MPCARASKARRPLSLGVSLAGATCSPQCYHRDYYDHGDLKARLRKTTDTTVYTHLADLQELTSRIRTSRFREYRLNLYSARHRR